MKQIVLKLMLRVFRLGYVECRKLAKKHLVIDILRRNAAERAAAYISERLSTSLIFSNRRELWDFVIQKLESEYGGGLAFEFGVYKGASLNYLASRLPTYNFFGFDSFLGLGVDWAGTNHGKGSYKTEMPRGLPENCTLIPGFFENSLPDFAVRTDINWGSLRFVHVDCDTYEGTQNVLDFLGEVGDFDFLILFDDYFEGYCWWEGEQKAFHEWLEKNNASSVPLGFTSSQAFFRVSKR